MEILLLGGLALALYAMVTGSSSSPSLTPAQQDLTKLHAANPTTFAAVNALLGNPNPATMNQYAIQLYALYPALAKQLGDMALALMTKVTGKSGTEWYTWIKSKNGTTMYIDLLYGSQPILTYTQDGAKRTYLSTYPNVAPATEAKAKADFIS